MDGNVLPHRLQGHYCRECGEFFPPGLKDNGPSPHVQVWQHYFSSDDTRDKQYQSCSRYCEERQQAEEITAGRRLYGKNVPPPPPEERAILKAQYDRLFPPD